MGKVLDMGMMAPNFADYDDEAAAPLRRKIHRPCYN